MASATATATAARPGQRLLARTPSPALVIGGIASVQFGSAISTKLFGTVGPAGAVLLRLVFASIALVALWRPRIKGRSRQDLWLSVIFGFVLAGMNLAFYESIQRIPLGVAVTIEFVGPLAVALVGSRRKLDFVWVALAALGIVALMRGDTHGLNTVGVVLALAAGCLWAAYIVVNARVGKAFADGSGLALAMCLASLLIVPVGVGEGGANLLHPHSLLLGAAVGLLSSAIPYTLELEALRRIAKSIFGVLMSLEPGVAALAGFLIIGQSLTGREFVGIALVIVASFGASLKARQAPVQV